MCMHLELENYKNIGMDMLVLEVYGKEIHLVLYYFG
ncbi:hypothetical protein C621_0218045 [Bacillus thuringiensis serovar aizawai str. Leapi01]|nr:hypothetical protein C623_0229425 [Bacillus thuringiensis serovar aizawai str. Hu4-2]ETE91491.1 hypothetical protein C621_0218045 [Bacillus thuringiensis serovar aizawai str. Leapi01]